MKTRKATTLLSLLILKPISTICSAPPRLKSGLELIDYNQRHRQLSDCAIKLDSSTGVFRGGTAQKSIFFTLSTQQDSEILSIEFAVNQNVPLSIDTEVFYRKGSFSGVISNPEDWIIVSSSPAQLAPNNGTAIVAVKEFQKITIEANTEYSLYVSLNSTDTMLVRPATAIGTVSQEDGVLTRYVGVSVNTGPFPSSLANAVIAEFAGVIHYKSVQTCTSILQTTKFDLQFAINDIPSAEHLTLLAGYFLDSINSVFITNTTLLEMKREHDINVDSPAANFMGRSDKCPDTFTECALVTTSAQIQHLPSMTSGQLRRQLLHSTFEIAESVLRLSTGIPSVVYVGGDIVGLYTAVEFQGVPGQMEGSQIKYFEIVFAEFLDDKIDGMDIHEVVLLSQETKSRRNLRLGSANGRDRRELQTSVASNVIVYGSGGNEATLRDSVFEAVLAENQQLIRSLQLEVLRPGILVLEPDVIVEPLFFTDLQGVRMTVLSTGGSTDTGGSIGSDGTDSSATTGSSWLLIVCAIVVALTTLFLIWRLYMDFCHKEKLTTTKLKRGDSTEPTLTSKPEEERHAVVEQSYDENPAEAGVEISLAKEKAVSAAPGPAPRSRSLDPMTKFFNRSGHKGTGSTKPRGRSASPTPPSMKRKLDGKDRPTRLARPNQRPRSMEREVGAQNESLSTRSAHVPRSTERVGDRVLLSKSSHQPRGMDSVGAGKRWKEAKDERDAARMRARRPRSLDRVPDAKNSNNIPGHASEPTMSHPPENSEHTFADEADSDLESESFLITDSPAKANGSDSEPVPSAPPTPQPPTNSPPPASTKSLDAKANFKDDQMALYSPEEGTELQLVQILKVQAFVGKKNVACYKIRLQASNAEKNMVKETDLRKVGEDSDVGVPPMGSPSTRRKKTKAKRKTKKSKSPTRNKSDGGKKKKKKKAKSSKSMEDLERMRQAIIERKNSGELKSSPKEGKQEITRAVRRSSSWNGKSQNAPANQPLFRLPRRKKGESKKDEDDKAPDGSSDDSSWGSFTKRPGTVKKKGSNAIGGNQQPSSSEEESD